MKETYKSDPLWIRFFRPAMTTGGLDNDVFQQLLSFLLFFASMQFINDFDTSVTKNNISCFNDYKNFSLLKISLLHRASDWFKKCIWRIPGLYSHCRSLHKLEWSFMMLSKGDRTTVEKNIDRKNLFYDNILKITILLKKFWFSKYYHRINFFLSTFFSTVVRSPLDNIMKDHSSLCRD